MAINAKNPNYIQKYQKSKSLQDNLKKLKREREQYIKAPRKYYESRK